jgi:hypothetical protein
MFLVEMYVAIIASCSKHCKAYVSTSWHMSTIVVYYFKAHFQTGSWKWADMNGMQDVPQNRPLRVGSITIHG